MSRYLLPDASFLFFFFQVKERHSFILAVHQCFQYVPFSMHTRRKESFHFCYLAAAPWQ